MKFLHTSDWHLGKRLEGRDRLCEQRAVLCEICRIADEHSVDVVLVAGDVFDTAVPTSEAEALFYDTAAALCKGGARSVVVIAGNHDDPARITAARQLGAGFGIVLSEGADSVRISRNGETAVIAMLSYPSDSRMQAYDSGGEGKTFSQRTAAWFAGAAADFSPDTINIAVSHLFALGGKGDGDERDIELGGARLVGREAFPRCHYTALGHLHRPQCIDRAASIYYSGSILGYSFDERGGKEVVVFEADAGGVRDICHVPLTSGIPLATLCAHSFTEAFDILSAHQNCYTSLTLWLDEPLSDSQNKTLKTTYPNLLKINLKLPESEKAPPAPVRRLSPAEIFEGFYLRENGSPPAPELTRLFVTLLEEGT